MLLHSYSAQIFARTVAVLLSAAVLAVGANAWTITARELVDVEFFKDDTLIVLVSAPGSNDPGLYRWPRGTERIELVCRITAPAMFSFDRQTVIERVRGVNTQLNVYAADTCQRVGTLVVDGRVLDVDVRGHQAAVALRTQKNELVVRLFRLPDELIAETAVGRNVEMGFAPDGRSLINFDVSDGGQTLWRWPDLQRQALPSWSLDGELTFVAGSPFVKLYRDQTLTIARWPDGNALHKITANRSQRLRALAPDGRFAVMQHQSDGLETLEWLDLAQNQRRVVARRRHGSIDHAALDATGTHLAWTERSANDINNVTVFRTHLEARPNALSTVTP